MKFKETTLHKVVSLNLLTYTPKRKPVWRRVSLSAKGETVESLIFKKVVVLSLYIESTSLNLQIRKCLSKMTS